ncbi:hypothetical protein SprV_0301059200 [Sparganum proliferum]
MLLALENSGEITPTDRHATRPHDTVLARFYGLPKVHKEGAPLRPIVSPRGSAIETMELPSQNKYDVTESRLGHAKVLQLLKLCLKTYFTFYGTAYEQLLTFKERHSAVSLHIQFTIEEEESNQLAFLDVLLWRKDCGGRKTKVFRKATTTTHFLNFSSNHPISHIRICVSTLYRSIEKHCSVPEGKIAKLQRLLRVFKASGYLHNFVNQCIRKWDERPNLTDPKFR